MWDNHYKEEYDNYLCLWLFLSSQWWLLLDYYWNLLRWSHTFRRRKLIGTKATNYKIQKINLTGEFNMLYVTSKYYLQYRMYNIFYQIYQRRCWVKGNIKHFTKLKSKDNYFSPSAFPQKNVLNTRTNINIKTLSIWQKIRMMNRISIMFVCKYILWDHKQAGNMTKNNWQEFFEIRKNYKKY